MRRLIYFLARFTAVIGGLVLMALVLMTTASIIGRTVNKMLHSPFFQEKLTGLSQGLIDMGIGEIDDMHIVADAGACRSASITAPMPRWMCLPLSCRRG